MKETKTEKFRRVAESRVNKIIKMIRLLGNCSNMAIYQYTPESVEKIFAALQTELDNAHNRYYTAEKPIFSLELPFNMERAMQRNPHITLKLPNGQKLSAVAFEKESSLNIYLCDGQQEPQMICFAEYNPDFASKSEVCVGAYRDDSDDTMYYAPYNAAQD